MRRISLRSSSSTWLATIAVAVAGRFVSMSNAISPISAPVSQLVTTLRCGPTVIWMPPLDTT